MAGPIVVKVYYQNHPSNYACEDYDICDDDNGYHGVELKGGEGQ